MPRGSKAARAPILVPDAAFAWMLRLSILTVILVNSHFALKLLNFGHKAAARGLASCGPRTIATPSAQHLRAPGCLSAIILIRRQPPNTIDGTHGAFCDLADGFLHVAA